MGTILKWILQAIVETKLFSMMGASGAAKKAMAAKAGEILLGDAEKRGVLRTLRTSGVRRADEVLKKLQAGIKPEFSRFRNEFKGWRIPEVEGANSSAMQKIREIVERGGNPLIDTYRNKLVAARRKQLIGLGGQVGLTALDPLGIYRKIGPNEGKPLVSERLATRIREPQPLRYGYRILNRNIGRYARNPYAVGSQLRNQWRG